jgi:hypothetical protein
MPFGQTGGKSECLADVLLFEVREVGKQLLNGPTAPPRSFPQ